MKARLVGSSLVALAIALQAPIVHAEDDSPPSPELSQAFKKADTNADGRLSQDEAKKAGFFSSQTFTSADADADGTVTVFELGKAVAQGSKAWLSDYDKADTNKDGVLDEKEASTSSRIAKVFTHADKDKNGTVDRNELMGEVTQGYYSDSDNAARPLVPNIIDEKF